MSLGDLDTMCMYVYVAIDSEAVIQTNRILPCILNKSSLIFYYKLIKITKRPKSDYIRRDMPIINSSINIVNIKFNYV